MWVKQLRPNYLFCQVSVCCCYFPICANIHLYFIYILHCVIICATYWHGNLILISFFLLSQSGLQSKKEKSKTRCRKLETVLQQLLESRGERWTDELRKDLPRGFQRHGDLVLLGDASFSLALWEKLGKSLTILNYQYSTFIHLYIFFFLKLSSVCLNN